MILFFGFAVYSLFLMKDMLSKQFQEIHHPEPESISLMCFLVYVPDILRDQTWRIHIDIDRISGCWCESAICRNTVGPIRKVAE